MEWVQPDESEDFPCFDDFFRADYPRLVTFLVRAGFGVEEAKDAAQSAMVAAYQAWSELRNPAAYVRTAARHAAINEAQRTRDGIVRSIRSGWVTPEQKDPYGAVDDRLDAGAQLLRFLALLPTRQRLVLSWHLDGFSNTEIAQDLDMSVGTVGSHLRHAKQRLKAERQKAQVPPTAAIEGGAPYDVQPRGQR